MSRKEESLTSLLEPAIEGLGYELVGIEHLPSGNHSILRIYIDSVVLLEVSTITMGGWTIAGDSTWGPQDEGDAIAALRTAFDCGINSFDTAVAIDFLIWRCP